MPSTKQRQDSQSARERSEKKYILVDKERHPYNLFPPIKDKTAQLGQVLEGKNFLRIMTEIGLNRYIIVQYYLYCEDDFWITGDAFVLNANPDKKILCQAMCVKTRRQCPCYDEDSHEFFTLCPNCRKIIVGLKKTDLICKHCDNVVTTDIVHKLPYLKCECEFCPVEIGWDEMQIMNENDKHFYMSRMLIRAEVAQQKLDDEVKELLNGAN